MNNISLRKSPKVVAHRPLFCPRKEIIWRKSAKSIKLHRPAPYSKRCELLLHARAMITHRPNRRPQWPQQIPNRKNRYENSLSHRPPSHCRRQRKKQFKSFTFVSIGLVTWIAVQFREDGGSKRQRVSGRGREKEKQKTSLWIFVFVYLFKKQFHRVTTPMYGIRVNESSWLLLFSIFICYFSYLYVCMIYVVSQTSMRAIKWHVNENT